MLKDRISYFLHNPLRIITVPIGKLPYFRFLHDTSDYKCRVSFEFWFKQKILNLGGNKSAYWPVHWTSKVFDAENIVVGVDSCPGIMKGCYIQGMGGIIIGDHARIAANVAIVSANHDVYDSRKHILSAVHIGNYCWIGFGAKIMPGVTLGDWTIVGAGAVVTKSFPDGYCVIGGVPGRIIRHLDREKCLPYNVEVDYNGYIRADRFKAFRKKYLNL
jgi:acetyltransferase-like isoleucine patch superfamily enzyme